MERICYCGVIFSTNRKDQKFCSKLCRISLWTSENKEKINEKTRKYRAKRYREYGQWRDEGPKAKELKEWMEELKSNPCADCGGVFPVCAMDFDHVRGEKKEYNVASMFAHHYSRELIEEELSKCDLVCSNCHRVRTRDRRTGSGKSGKARQTKLDC